MKVTIQEAKPEDAEGILHVQRLTWITTYPNDEEGVTKEDIEQKVKTFSLQVWQKNLKPSRSRKTWVVKDNDKVVGFAVASKDTHVHHLRALYIIDRHQRKGIGKKLTEKALKWLGDDKEIYTRAVDFNKRAIEFYKSFGFEEIGLEDEKDWFRFPSGNIMKGIILRKKPSF